jgi:hypothetical protein
MIATAVPVWSGRQLVLTQRVRNRRGELGLTQQQVVARLARYGIRTTNRVVSNVERGAGVDVVKLPELAAALDCTVSYLLGLTNDPHRWEPDASPAPTPASTAPVPAAQRHSLILGVDVPDRTLGPVSGRGGQ